MCNMCAMYEHGEGVEQQSYEKAFEYYEQAADLGHRMAQFYLGLLYATGQGVTKDESKGEKMADRISSTRIREVYRESQNTWERNEKEHNKERNEEYKITKNNNVYECMTLTFTWYM